MRMRHFYLSCLLTVSPWIAAAQVPSTAGESVSVTGCLNAAPDGKSYVLTADANPLATTTERSAGSSLKTFTYALVGGENLQAQAGKKVTVKGRLDKTKDQADADARDVSEQPRTDKPGGTAKVESKQDIDIRVRQLHVESVTPTGQACNATPEH